MICLKTGLPHPGDPCSPCLRVEEVARRTREDPRVVELREAADLAWAAKQTGKHLPLLEWDRLDAAWRKAVDDAQATFARVWVENWAEKVEEYNREEAAGRLDQDP